MSSKSPVRRSLWTSAVVATWLVTAVAPAISLLQSKRAAPPPDMTRGEKKTGDPDWNLGPTGAKGWIFAREFDTSEARQILIGSVAKGSPAEEVLKPGDVIVGVGDKPFDADARRAFAEALAAAESEAGHGSLTLLRWREGTVSSIAIALEPRKSFSGTSPWNCAKAARIIEDGCRSIAQRGFPGGSIDKPTRGDNWDPEVLNSVNAMALLASGKPEYLALVSEYARKVGPKELDLVMREGLYAWTWGYAALFLTEYYLVTKDDFVLPAIREYAHKIAIGQSEVGTWGHGFRVEGNNGTLGGYGAINQCGLVCWISLILAEKCGIDDPAVHTAVRKSHEFFRFYIGKGSVPYGDHPPYWLHDDNGKSAAAAVAFDLMGLHDGARFFSRMATAAYGEKELGHTGNYLGLLWGALGSNRAGPDAVSAFLREQRWYYDLARRFDGSFFTIERDNYGWDMTGIFVLHASLPLRTLWLTGKGVDESKFLRGDALASVIASGRDFNLGTVDKRFATMSNVDIVGALGDWSPSVRIRAARVIGERKEQADALVPMLLPMLASDARDARLGACVALEQLGIRAAPATDALIALLSDSDMWVRIRAAFALTTIGKPAMKAVPELLRRCAIENSADPRGIEAKYLSFALFRADYIDQVPNQSGLVATSLDGVDRALVFPVIRRMLACDDGLGTVAMRSIFRTLPDDELQSLELDIATVASRTPPSGEMFAQEIRVEALRYMAKHRIVKGLPVFIEYARTQNGWGSKTKEILPLLTEYGVAAKAILPELRVLAAQWKTEDSARREDTKEKEKTKAMVAEEVIRTIELAS
ncbi:MAG: DUF6288 domain-containing protein [Phycisphaerae bacterium]|nr:DUF6288 domain-containing protein [Phycisphaerae bacterium]